MNTPVVIYHNKDFDGIFCREIARKFLPQNTRFIGWDYSEPPIVLPENISVLYMLDISVKELMDHPALVWIDHHKSAIAEFGPDIYGYQIDGVAACRLTWQWFTVGPCRSNREPHAPAWVNGGAPVFDQYFDRLVDEPLAVRLAGEYDIWDKAKMAADPDIALFQHALRSEELEAITWDDLLSKEGDCRTVLRLLDQGRAIQFAKQQENASIILAYGYTLQFEGLTFLACNHAQFNSQLFAAAVDSKVHQALLGYHWTGSKWRISLYHAQGREHIDLSLIAKRFGGGGHAGACGFNLPFEKGDLLVAAPQVI